MSTFTVFGRELEYDFFDADELERYQDANARVDKEFKKLNYNAMSTADALRAQCSIINTFFDTVFGKGTAAELFGGKNNIKDHLEAFAEVTNAALDTDKEMRRLSDSVEARYSPNRAQRRFEAKNGNGQNRGNNQHPQNGKQKNGNRYGGN